MSRVPMMPVFTDAMIGGTVRLSAEQFGAYCLILFATWANNGSPLRDDDIELARVCRCTVARWRAKLRPAVIQFFDHGDGLLHQRRLENEFKIASKNAQQRRDAGTRGGIATQLKNKETRQASAQASAKAQLKQPIPIPKKKGEREPCSNTQSLRAGAPAIGEPVKKTRPSRPSLKIKIEGEGQAENAAPGEAPGGWLAAATDARDEAGLEAVNMPLEWAKFATRANGEIELRRWLEWALRAWVQKPRQTNSATPPPPDVVAEVPWAARMRQWQRSRWWHPNFGPQPGEPGCWVPAKFLAEATE